MKYIILLSTFFLLSCASPLVKEDATNVFVEKTNLSKKAAFNKTISFLAKNLNDSNHAIKLKDASQGKIISKLGIECNDLRGFADVTSYTAYYTLEIDVKNKKMRIAAVGETFTQKNIDGSVISVNTPLRSGHKGATKKCAEKIKGKILAALKSSNTNW